MSLTMALKNTIEEANIAMNNHPQSDLILGYRQVIYNALNSNVNAASSSGFKRQVMLAILSTEYVLPIWESMVPNDNTPHEILEKARQVIKENVDKSEFWKERDQFLYEITEFDYENEHLQIVTGVVHSAIQALTLALTNEQNTMLNIDLSLTDADIDPDEMDASFFAAAVYANGAIWNPESNTEKRKEFWEWWLSKAVPSAWGSFE